MRNTVVIVVTIIAAGVWLCCGGAEERTQVQPEEAAGTVTNTSEETPANEEVTGTLDDFTIQEMERLKSKGYPVYNKNIIFCSGVTEAFGPEYIVLETGDEKDEVVNFYVAAGGKPDYYETGTDIYRVWGGPPDVETHDEDDDLSYDEEEVVLFRDWEMPVGVRASREGEGTEVIYDVLGDVFSAENE
ncbi:MAG: hypothetical protein JSW52_09945 [Candidatus Coatesbacteria bacterium]|nr:MAG: hypothetical protein JSW52_09945 [Candidatus Coatesbacteria bacterium]